MKKRIIKRLPPNKPKNTQIQPPSEKPENIPVPSSRVQKFNRLKSLPSSPPKGLNLQASKSLENLCTAMNPKGLIETDRRYGKLKKKCPAQRRKSARHKKIVRNRSPNKVYKNLNRKDSKLPKQKTAPKILTQRFMECVNKTETLELKNTEDQNLTGSIGYLLQDTVDKYSLEVMKASPQSSFLVNLNT